MEKWFIEFVQNALFAGVFCFVWLEVLMIIVDYLEDRILSQRRIHSAAFTVVFFAIYATPIIALSIAVRNWLWIIGGIVGYLYIVLMKLLIICFIRARR